MKRTSAGSLHSVVCTLGVLFALSGFSQKGKSCFELFYAEGEKLFQLWQRGDEAAFDKAIAQFQAAKACKELQNKEKKNQRADEAIRMLNAARIKQVRDLNTNLQKGEIDLFLEQSKLFYSNKEYATAYRFVQRALAGAKRYHRPDREAQIQRFIRSSVYLHYFSDFLRYFPRNGLLWSYNKKSRVIEVIKAETGELLNRIETSKLNLELLYDTENLMFLPSSEEEENVTVFDMRRKDGYRKPFTIENWFDKKDDYLSKPANDLLVFSKNENFIIYQKDSQQVNIIDIVAQTVTPFRVLKNEVIKSFLLNPDERFVLLQIADSSTSRTRVINLADKQVVGDYCCFNDRSITFNRPRSSLSGIKPLVMAGEKLMIYYTGRSLEKENDKDSLAVSNIIEFGERGNFRIYDLKSGKRDTVLRAARDFDWYHYINSIDPPFNIGGGDRIPSFFSFDSVLISPYLHSGISSNYSDINSFFIFPILQYNVITKKMDTFFIDKGARLPTTGLLHQVAKNQIIYTPDTTTLVLFDFQSKMRKVFSDLLLVKQREVLREYYYNDEKKKKLLPIITRHKTYLYNLAAGQTVAEFPSHIQDYRLRERDSSISYVTEAGMVNLWDTKQRVAVPLFQLREQRRMIDKIYLDFTENNQKLVVAINYKTNDNILESEIASTQSVAIYVYNLQTKRMEKVVAIKDGWFVSGLNGNFVELENDYSNVYALLQADRVDDPVFLSQLFLGSNQQ